jgi:cytochrome c biogenesis protein ResB
VFPVRNAEQIQVELTDAHGEFAADGQPLDYSSDMVIYKNGDEVKRCESTVNSPCAYDGYRFYQAAYFGFGAAVQVKDTETGNVVYRETLALIDRAPSPHVLIQDAGDVAWWTRSSSNRRTGHR